ncbi:hypothetical protein CRG98_022266 [Punica granatum]|uniref:Uncharacterized protein n=1 Tax=Punica granatum TaxID=22663 RepID=A0A2I0JM23_PUNGR|nr:hypothetical protein CRG98_022266 [Punica granatum]
MVFRCPDSYGVPLMSHAGSTTYFPARVVRQLGGLQTDLEDTARTRFEHTWREDQTPVDRQSNVEQVLDAWRTVITERPYFPEHPTQDERDFQATEEYILRFHRWGPSKNDDFTDSLPVESSTSSGAPHAFTALGSGPTSSSSPTSGSDPTFTASDFGPTSGSGPASGSDPAYTASGFGPASGSGLAFTASGFGPAFGFWPCIGLRLLIGFRPHF